MNLRLLVVTLALSSPLAAQFVNAVRNNQVNAGYVNAYSKSPEDQIVQWKMSNPVIKVPASTPATPLQPYRTPQSADQDEISTVGLPSRAREALETAATTEGTVVASTDAAGNPRFTTTVVAPPRIVFSERRRSEPFMTPLNAALWKSVQAISSLDLPESGHRLGRK